MPNKLLMPLGFLDEVVHPFHRMMAAITFVGTLSIQAVVTAYLEPVRKIWYSFVLTFPLTTGLTIVFLVLYNYSWKRSRVADLFVGAGMFALLFLSLNGFYALLGLRKLAPVYEREEKNERLKQHFSDSVDDPVKYQQLYREQQRALDSERAAAPPSPAPGTTVGQSLKAFARENRDFKVASPAERADGGIFSRLAVPFLFLWSQLKQFYRDYGPTRFWSGVVLALCFSIYLNAMGKKLKGKSSEPVS